MKNLKTTFFSCLLLCTFIGTSQAGENTTLQQWTNKDALHNAPQNGNPVIPGYYADPTIIEDNGTFYMYATSDLSSWDAITKMGVWSSTDLKNWTCTYLNWPTKEQCVSNTGRPDGVWAPSVIKAKNGKFYMYVTVGREIWVGVADAPLGPWKNALPDNQPLIRHKEHYYVETIDAECFIDDDGQAYLYWGSQDTGFSVEGRCLGVKLNDDMVTFEGEIHDVSPPHFFEAPYMVKRNGTYYFMYSWGKTWDQTYQVRYATGKTPFGPWKEGLVRPIVVGNEKKDRITSTGHHTMLQYQGKDYIVYHRFNTMGNYDIAKNLRQVAIDELVFDDKGGMQHVLTTHKGTLPKVESTRKNLAFGAKITSSSDLDSITKADYAIDENNATLWIGGKAKEEWLTVDLGKTTPIEQIALYVEYPIYAYAYKLAISENGTDWKTVDDQMKNTKIGSPMILNKKLNARYVRVTMPNTGNRQRPALWEIKVY